MRYSETDGTRHSRHLRFRRGIAGSRIGSAIAFATLSISLVAVVACSAVAAPATTPPASESPAPTQQPVASPSPDPSTEPSADPSTNPSAEPSGPATPTDEPMPSPFVPADLGPDRIGRVVATDGLRVRTLPTVGESSQRLEPTLDEGTTFYVVDGPVLADGYAWYQVDPYGGDAALPFGWIAAGSREGDPWIENHLDGCDSVYPSVEQLGAAAPQENLYCYGVEMPGEYELTGNLVCEFGDVEGLASGPAWVEFDRYCELRAPDFDIHDGISIRIWGQAATGLLDQGSPVDGQYTVTGHFDDPGAGECVSADPDQDPAAAVLLCRMQFVATAVTPANG